MNGRNPPLSGRRFGLPQADKGKGDLVSESAVPIGPIGLDSLSEEGQQLGAGDEGGLEANRVTTGLEEQVTATGEEFRAWLIEDDAGFEGAGDLEANPGGQIGLDEAVDDGAFRALGGENEMDPGGAGLLAEALEIGGEGVFLRSEGDEIGKFVAAEDEAWEGRLRVGLIVAGEVGKAGEEGVAALHFPGELIEQGDRVAGAGKL